MMVDASTSMRTPFTAASLNKRAATDATFFTTVAAAERFVRLRMKSQYRDLLALVEFGNEAYVVTPFTHDYDNILLSICLIGDPVEFSMFPDQGTIIGRAIEEGTALFKAFDFLDASGNLMVIFSDGEDTRAMIGGRSLDDIVASALQGRRSRCTSSGPTTTGPRARSSPTSCGFRRSRRPAASSTRPTTKQALLNAIEDIDSVSTGTIEVRQYSSQQPQFAIFALIAAGVLDCRRRRRSWPCRIFRSCRDRSWRSV